MASGSVRWQRLEARSLYWTRTDCTVASDEIVTIKELARLLKVADKTVYTMAQNKELPAFKVRGQWRLRREDIDRWIEKQKDAGTEEGHNE